MDMQYTKKLTFYLFFLVALYSEKLTADWNEDFDAQTTQLIHVHPAFQNSSYKKKCKQFQEIRKKLLADSTLISEVQNQPMELKSCIKRELLNVIVKVRRRNDFHDLYPWEFSYFAGSSDYVVPSYPMEIGGRVCVVQFLENFEIGTLRGGGHKHNLKKLSLKTYWKALLQSYIFGMCDLVLSNIAVNSAGGIRYFDNESSLIYFNDPSINSNSFKMGFISQAFDFPHFDRPINSKSFKEIKSFIGKLINFEKDLDIYLKYRAIDIDNAALKTRLKKIRSYPLKQGNTFRDFYSWINPRVCSGLNELSKVLEPILNQEGAAKGPGTSLIYMTRRLKYFNISPQTEKLINQWIKKYVE